MDSGTYRVMRPVWNGDREPDLDTLNKVVYEIFKEMCLLRIELENTQEELRLARLEAQGGE